MDNQPYQPIACADGPPLWKRWALVVTLLAAKAAYLVSLWFYRQHERISRYQPAKRKPFQFCLADLFLAMLAPAFLGWMVHEGWFIGDHMHDAVSIGIFAVSCVLACIVL